MKLDEFNEGTFFKAFVGLWVIAALVGIAFWSFIIWAIYTLVTSL